ncbi:MAG: histidine racemase [Bacillota bacterium]|nr:histidine racemase [Bacillota bacterium]
MRLRFVKMNPTGNTTIFVLDPVPVPEQARIAVALMDPSVLGGEQVGFVSLSAEEEPPRAGLARGHGPDIAASLRMMGGEFCGNAARSLGAYLAYKHHPGLSSEGDVARGFIRVSGAKDLVEVEARLDQDAMPCWAGCTFPGPFRVVFYRAHGQALENGVIYEPCSNTEGLSRTWLGIAAGAVAEAGSEANKEAEVTAGAMAGTGTSTADASCDGQSMVAVVHLPGITHIVVDADEYAPTEDVLFRLRSALGLEAEPCVGVMFCHGPRHGREHGHGHGHGHGREHGHDDGHEDVVPLVHVSATGTTVWESSCASGAVAVALAKSIAGGHPGRFTSRQPRGTLYTTVDFGDGREPGRGATVRLEGEVRIVAEGDVFL